MFDLLPRADQDAAFGKARAQRIRDGEDLQRVVNETRSRRGPKAPGQESVGGRSSRGKVDEADPRVRAVMDAARAADAGREFDRASVLRRAAYQMSGIPTIGNVPEALAALAGSDRGAAVALLKAAGYLA